MATTVLGLKAVTADGSSDELYHGGGPLGIIATGTFGSGTCKLQVRSAAGTYVDVPGVSLTAAGNVYDSLPAGYYRITLAGSTNPVLTAKFQP